jgi:glyoxylase-like metal-dependent hydrolase (beta-lactamase superfamily II)/ferredoxin
MAQLVARRPENVPGPFFVDATCIDCDTCRWMAPETFARRGGQSAVARQPKDADARRRALQALVACPTASIGADAPAPDVQAAAADFPLPVTPSVAHLGFHSASSFGATAYLLRTSHGNAMVDCPRFVEPLARRLEGLGGVRLILLTHRDDVADHGRWARRLGATRVLHERDLPAHDGPPERVLSGDDAVELLPGLTAIPTPGHTAGHVCYHWAGDEGVLFTGDHLAFDDEAGGLEAWPDVCWFDWKAQARSMERLADWPATWVLPGHGRRGRIGPGAWRGEVGRLVAWMRAQ